MKKIFKHFFVYSLVAVALAVCLGYQNFFEARGVGAEDMGCSTLSEEDLVGYWKFDEGSGTVAADSAATNHGSLKNMDPVLSWVAGKGADFGTALDFDGTDDYVEIRDDLLYAWGNGPVSIAMWMKADDTTPTWADIFFTKTYYWGAGGEAGAWEGIDMRLESDGRLRSVSNAGTIYTNSSISSGWHHYVLTTDPVEGKRKWYIDGTPYNSIQDTPSNYWLSNRRNLFIGSYYTGESNFDGQIDEVRIYNRALSDAEVQALYEYIPGSSCSDVFSVSLSSDPWGGNWPVNDVDLTADVSGTAAGTINYTFYCDCDDSGTDPSTSPCNPWDHKIDGTGSDPYTVANVCDYPAEGIYTAKVIAERGGFQEEDRVKVAAFSSSVRTGGLWGHYLYGSDRYDYEYSRLYSEEVVENINFDGIDGRQTLEQVFVNRLNRSNDATAIWSGSIYAPKTGVYNFHFLGRGKEVRVYFEGRGSWRHAPYSSIDGDVNIHLDAGWHGIVIDYGIHSITGAWLNFLWTPPGGQEEIVPASVLSPEAWSDRIIAIPDLSKPKEKIKYLVAAAGGKDGSPVNISIDLQAEGLTINDIIKDEVWMFAGYEDSVVGHSVTNNADGVTRAINTAQTFVSSTGWPVGIIEAKLPEQAIYLDGAGKLNLSFNLDGGSFNSDGIVLLVPYIDESVAYTARLYIRARGHSSYQRASPVYLFPVRMDEGLTTDDIRPFFVFGDGETRTTMQEDPPTHRPNYMWYVSGDIEAGEYPPGEFEIIQNMPGAVRLMPRDNGPPSLGNPYSWYPAFGREGPQIDVVSQNYTPNAAPGATTGGGLLDTFSIPEGDDWVAFQAYGLNFPGDGVSTGAGESMFMFGGGLVSIDPLEELTLPEIPMGVNASSTLCETANISWNDGIYEDYYVIQRKSTLNPVFATTTTLAQNTTFFHDTSLGNIEYTYRVRACNDDDTCSSFSSEVSVVPASCGPQPYFTLQSSGSVEINLSGNVDDITTSTETKITATSFFGFADDISLSVDPVTDPFFGIPGVVYNFSDNILSEAEYPVGSQFSVTLPGNIPPGVYAIIVRGDGGSYIAGVSVTLYVNSIAPDWREI